MNQDDLIKKFLNQTPASTEDITVTNLRRAREDYKNDIRDLTFYIKEGMTDGEFIKALQNVGFEKLPMFAEKFADQELYPDVIKDMPEEIVSKLDYMANEINNDFKASIKLDQGILTIEKVRRFEAIIKDLLKDE
jgi:hypothetical protein